jgi:hypothetical protein
LQFWQVYFVTVPHRWITLAVVFLDRERFHERRGTFLGLAALATAVCLGVRLTTGTLTCLLAIDYLWNAWHFASQHHGIYRIYTRLSDPARTAGLVLEKWAMRGFLLYVTLRVAGATWSNFELEAWLQRCDWAVLAVPAWLLARDAVRFGRGARGRTMYLASVLALYVALLAAVHLQKPGLVLSLATASALFHAIEYLSIVGWSVERRSQAGRQRMGLLGYAVPRWGLALAVFMLTLGVGGWLMDQNLMEAWLFVNLIAALLHYAYDGLIWRSPRRAAPRAAATSVAAPQTV